MTKRGCTEIRTARPTVNLSAARTAHDILGDKTDGDKTCLSVPARGQRVDREVASLRVLLDRPHLRGTFHRVQAPSRDPGVGYARLAVRLGAEVVHVQAQPTHLGAHFRNKKNTATKSTNPQADGEARGGEVLRLLRVGLHHAHGGHRGPLAHREPPWAKRCKSVPKTCNLPSNVENTV